MEEFNLDTEATVSPRSTAEYAGIEAARSFLNEIRLDNTKRSVAAQCLRKFQLAHMFGLKGIWGATALRYGKCWHGFMEGYYGTIRDHGWEMRDLAINNAILRGKSLWDDDTAKQQFYDDYRTFENCCAAFLEYVVHFAGDQEHLQVIATEQVFALPLTLDTEAEKRMYGHLPPITFTGKIDLQLVLSGQKWIKEFKTTGRSLEIESQRLYRSTQILGYSYAAPRFLAFQPGGTLVSLHYLYSRKGKSGDYGKVSIDFSRVPQIFTEYDLLNWKMDFLKTCDDIHRAETHGHFPCRFDSCFAYNRPCQYYRLCTQNVEPESFMENLPEGYMIDFWDVEGETNGDDA